MLALQLSVPVGGDEFFRGGEKKAKQTHSVCLDLKGKEGREDILAARLERRVDVCSVRRPRQHCDCSVAVRTLGR